MHATKKGDGRTKAPKVAMFGKFNSMEEALVKAEKAGVTIASSKTLSSLSIPDYPRLIPNNSINFLLRFCDTGTLFAHIQPDTSFREKTEQISSLGNRHYIVKSRARTRYLFPVPEEHLDGKNLALVVEHPFYRIEKDGRYRIVVADTIDSVAGFPRFGANYFCDPVHGIPSGDPVPRSSSGDSPDLLTFVRPEASISFISRIYHGFGIFGYGFFPESFTLYGRQCPDYHEPRAVFINVP
jgi:hypothetical protein